MYNCINNIDARARGYAYCGARFEVVNFSIYVIYTNTKVRFSKTVTTIRARAR